MQRQIQKIFFTFLVFFFSFWLQAKQNELSSIAYKSVPALNKKAITTDWPRFNGAYDNASSTETHLLKDWKNDQPETLWEIAKGEGYASPAVSQGILVLFHRKEGMESIEGLNSETGQMLWSYNIQSHIATAMDTQMDPGQVQSLTAILYMLTE